MHNDNNTHKITVQFNTFPVKIPIDFYFFSKRKPDLNVILLDRKTYLKTSIMRNVQYTVSTGTAQNDGTVDGHDLLNESEKNDCPNREKKTQKFI